MKKRSLFLVAVLAIIVWALAGCASVSIVNVEWDTLEGPEKVRQYYNVPGTDIKLYANYKDGSRKQVTMVTASLDKDNTGTQTVTVTVFANGTGTFQTEVMELTGIRVDKPPLKTTYNIGESAELTGIRVMGIWRDFPDAEISSYQINVASFNSNSAGTNRLVTVEYKGKTATFPVTVKAASAPAPAQSAQQQPAQQQPSQQQPSQQQPPTQQPPAAQQPTQPAQQQQSQQLERNQLFVGTWKADRRFPNTPQENTATLALKADGTGTLTTTLLSGGNPSTTKIVWSSGGISIYIGESEKILNDNILSNNYFGSLLNEDTLGEWGRTSGIFRRQR